MPFGQLVNAQQMQATVTGPGDANTLYLCAGLAQGNFSLTVPGNSSQQSSDTWQFEVGPALGANQFRRAIGTAALAGVQESEGGAAQVYWTIQAVFADFDDDTGLVRVSVTNNIYLSNQAASTYAAAGVSMLAYNVSILAAMPPAT